jgi:hypothetical protein
MTRRKDYVVELTGGVSKDAGKAKGSVRYGDTVPPEQLGRTKSSMSVKDREAALAKRKVEPVRYTRGQMFNAQLEMEGPE